MRFFITYDANWEAGLDEVLHNIHDHAIEDFFAARDYGSSIEHIAIFLICRNPAYNFKQRIRFLKKEKTLYMDIMLDLDEFKRIDQTKRERIVAGKLVKEIPPVVAKYKFADFDLAKFETDLKSSFKRINWI